MARFMKRASQTLKQDPMNIRQLTACFALSFAFPLACGGETSEEETDSQEAEIGEAFRSKVEDRGALALEDRKVPYKEDARPYETADLGVKQTPGGSRYVGYTLKVEKGDGLLLAAQKGSETTPDAGCDDVVRLWILDSKNRVVRTGTQYCESEYEVPDVQSKSKITRHYFDSAGMYKIVLAVLPGRGVPANSPSRKAPWGYVSLDVIRSHEADQGEAGSRCTNGVDILCQSTLKCERARCK